MPDEVTVVLETETPEPEAPEVNVTIEQPQPERSASDSHQNDAANTNALEILRATMETQSQTFNQLIESVRERVETTFDRISEGIRDLGVVTEAMRQTVSENDEELDNLRSAVEALIELRAEIPQILAKR